MKKYFEDLGEFLFNELNNTEELNLNLSGEESTYLRFNKAQIRQNTFVDQKTLTLTYHGNGRKVVFDLSLSGQKEVDQQNTLALLMRAREEAQNLPPDPFLVPMKNQGQSSQTHQGKLLSPTEAIQSLTDLTQGTDFVGLYTAGPVFRANQNSKGQKNWFSNESFFVDYSLFTTNVDGENKAVKDVYAGTHWNSKDFENQLQNSQNQLSFLKRKSLSLKPGRYRAFLAPGAMAEITGLLSGNALSFGAMKKGHCPFQKLYDKKETLSPLLTLKENFALGLCPQFNSLGEMAPETLTLIEKGVCKNLLVSTRSAQEYGVTANGADGNFWSSEFLRSPEIRGGSLPEAQALEKLGTGLFLSNLHYLNWSDEVHARFTGMTRYACFWVEKGEVVGPIQDLRFDDSLYSLFGSELEAITQEQHIDPSIHTYFQREIGGKKIPGMMIRNMSFTL